MMALEKQRSAFSSRPERRDVAALLIAGASRASLVDKEVVPQRSSARLQQQKQLVHDPKSNKSANLPIRPTSSNLPLETKTRLKGQSEQKFRQLAAALIVDIKSNFNAMTNLPSSDRLQETLHAADAVQARLQASKDDLEPVAQPTANPVHTASSPRIVTSKSSRLQHRNITEAWV
jgi:hypothetical protein